MQHIRDGHKAAGLGDHDFRIAAIGLEAGVALILTMDEVAGPARAAVAAVAAEEADADALADRPAFHVLTKRLDVAHHLVTGNARPRHRERAIDGRGIEVAHAAGLHP